MAMRQRSGDATATLPRQSTRPVYEDFWPRSERKEEAAETIILVHLPGFVKERIKITYVNSSRMVRVHGQRPLLDNIRWSRFNQVFPVPENCDTDKIHGNFQHGILTLTMPKTIIARVGPAEEAKTTQKAPSLPKSTAEPKPQKVQEEIPPTPAASTSGVEKQRKEEIAQPQSLKRTASEPNVEKGMEDIPPKATSNAIDERQRVVKSSQSQSPLKKAPSLPKSTAEPKPQKVQEEIPPTPAASTSGVEKQRKEEIAQPQSLKRPATEPNVEKGMEDIPPKATSNAIDERQRVVKSSQSQSPLKKAPSLPKSTAEPKPQKVQEEIPPTPAASTSGVEKQRKEEIAQPQSLKRTASEPNVEKGMEDIPPKATSNAIDERQRVVKSSQSQSPLKATTEPKAQKGQDLAPPKAIPTSDTRNLMDKTRMASSADEKVDHQKSIGKEYILIGENGEAKETKESQKVMENKMVKGKESGEKIADSVKPERAAPKISENGKEKKERSYSGGKEEQPKEHFQAEKGIMGIKIVMDSAKQRVNNLAKRLQNEDERQMLVNIGAVVLVIVALGAYLSYSYRSSGRSSED